MPVPDPGFNPVPQSGRYLIAAMLLAAVAGVLLGTALS